jgi:hypothetical protein
MVVIAERAIGQGWQGRGQGQRAREGAMGGRSEPR